MTRIRYGLEALLVRLMLLLFKAIGPDPASALGGWLGRTIGPRLAASRKALRNLDNSLPEQDNHSAVIKGMWDNLGRVIAEYPHLRRIGRDRVTIINQDILESIKSHGGAVVLFTAHLGNWEIAPAVGLAHDYPFDVIYRAPNNPIIDRLLCHYRGLNGAVKSYPKSRSGMRDVVRTIKNNHPIGILIDQKYNEGIAADFFGRPAMTSTAFIDLAKNYDALLCPVRIERLNGANFQMTFYEPLDVSGPVEKTLQKAHILLEGWIKQRPDQWLWLHRRWDSDKLKDLS